jgi:transglutaminase-like putative cysteine protease
MRSLLLIVSIALGYGLLRGWPESTHAIIRVCLAVSTLVVAFGLWGRAEKPTSPLAKPARAPRFLDYLTVGIAVLLVECFFLIFLSVAPSKSEELALSLDESLHPEVYFDESEARPDVSNSESRSATGTGRVTSNWLGSGPGRRSLNKNEKVRPSNLPEVYLFPDSPADAQRLLATTRFLRNVTLATYEDGTWLPQTGTPTTLGKGNGPITFPAKHPYPPVSYAISHQASSGGQTLAVTVPDAVSLDLPSLRQVSPDTFRLPVNAVSKGNFRYQVSSIPFDFERITSEIIPGESPSPAYLALPSNSELRQKIQTLAAAFGPASRASLLKVRETLRTRCQYSLEIDMPEDAEPLESFLFQTRTGYCTHFATATAMITRAMGIPSRIAFGWSGGRYFEGPNLFVFRAREAHAWTEIYLKDHGWVIFETTPASRDEGAPSLAGPDEPSPFADLKTSGDEPIEKSDLAPLLKAATWIGIAAALALLITLLLRRPTITVTSQSPGLNILPDPPNYLSAFRRACLAHGHPMPPGRTLRAHLEKITTPAFTADLLHYHYAVQYGDAPRDKATEKKLLSSLRNWEKESS